MLLMIDNYDSFTFNLVHYFPRIRSRSQSCSKRRNKHRRIRALSPDYIVISPGPCDPDKAGISLAAIEAFAGKIPLLGVCLGHQAIAQSFGATVKKAKKVMHGKTSEITHNDQGVFQWAE